MRRITSFVVLVAVLFTLGGCDRSRETESEPLLRIIFFDVGQGNCALLRTPDGDLLIDAGTEDCQTDLCTRLELLGVSKLSLLILTHADEDHMGGADGILERFEVDGVWFNGERGDNDSYQQFERMIQKRKVPLSEVKAGDGVSLGNLHLTVLAPSSETEATGNEGSLAILIRCASFGALMMGDCPDETELAMIDSYGNAHLNVDVLCVGHHGANTSTCSAFLETVQPEYAVISCGAGNSYGHPDGRTLARLENVGADVLRTDLEGDICFSVYENEFVLSDSFN